jgi:hypothetical protein
MTKIPLTEKEILEFIQGELDTNEDEMADARQHGGINSAGFNHCLGYQDALRKVQSLTYPQAN